MKVEIDLNDDDFSDRYTGSSVYDKLEALYKKAKGKEIKEGDWCLYGDNCVYQVAKGRLSLFKNGLPDIKLPQKLQDGLNEFMEKHENS